MAAPDPLALYADTILVDGWCLRSALVRYAQAEPKRSTVVHAFMRRLDGAIAACSAGDTERRQSLVPLVGRFESLADVMSAWAAHRDAHVIPTAAVDALLREAPAEFERLAIPEETVDPAEWRGMRSTEGRRGSSAKARAKADPG